MPFVKLDCQILRSTIWFDRDAREVFITALLMAEPRELKEPLRQLEIQSLKETGFVVPPGWYGFAAASGPGIIHTAQVNKKEGLKALERLGAPEPDSRTKDHGGRRMVRVDGGFVILNYIKYRERDHTAAERSRRYREKKQSKRHTVASRKHAVASRNVTQAEAEAEAEAEKETDHGLQQELQEIVSLFKALFKRKSAATASLLKIYSGWRKAHSFEDAKRMLYLRRIVPAYDSHGKAEVWSRGTLRSLLQFNVKRKNDGLDQWFEYLTEVWNGKIPTTVKEIMHGRGDEDILADPEDPDSHSGGGAETEGQISPEAWFPVQREKRDRKP